MVTVKIIKNRQKSMVQTSAVFGFGPGAGILVLCLTYVQVKLLSFFIISHSESAVECNHCGRFPPVWRVEIQSVREYVHSLGKKTTKLCFYRS